MKKTPFLSYILAALFAGIAFTSCTDELNGNETLDLGNTTVVWHTVNVTGTNNRITNGELTLSEINISNGGVTLDCTLSPYEYDDGTMSYDAVYMKGDATLNLANKSQDFELNVSSTGNTLENAGAFLGSITLADGSYLTIAQDGDLHRRTDIVLGTGSTLELVTSSSHRWIDNLAGIQVTGDYATIKNAELVMRNHSNYTLGNGVEKLLYDESTCFVIMGATFNLANYTTNLDIIVHVNANYINRIEQGRINTRVQIDSAALRLEDVTLGNNASIEMGDYSTLTLHMGLTAENGSMIYMGSGSTLNLGNQTRDFAMTVTGTGNTLENGTFIGSLTLEEGSHLKSDSAMASWDGPTSIVMKNGSTLEMVPGQGKDICINNPSVLQVEGKATINNAYLVVRTNNRPNHEYVLDDGVASLEGSSYYLLPGDEAVERFNLNKHTANFDIIVWESGMASDITISNGRIDKSVQILNTSGGQPNGKLTLENVTLGDNASFTLGANTELDMGGAEGTVWLNPDSAEGIKVRNGRIGLPGAPVGPETHDAMVYTVSFSGTDHKPTYIEGNYIKLKLEENIKFATRHNTRYLVEEACIGNPNRPVSLDVKAEGHFLLGDFYNEQGARETKTIYGDVNVSHTGVGLSDNTGTADVDILYRLIGNLSATEMKGGAIFIGAIGYERDATKYGDETIPGGTVTVGGASRITVSSFIGQSMELAASGAVMLTGNGRAYGAQWNGAEEVTALKDSATLVIGGVEEDRPEINFQANLSAHTIALTGTDISGTGSYGHASAGATFVEFADSCTINATGTVNIQEGFKGGDLTVAGGGNVVLDLLGIPGTKDTEAAPLASAEITSVSGDIGIRSFTGGTLYAWAEGQKDANNAVHGAVTITKFVEATAADPTEAYAAEIRGGSVSIGESLTATTGSNFVQSTSGDITIGETLSAGVSSTLDSAADITVSGDVTGGNLTATAGDSILMKKISIGDKSADLTAGTAKNTEGNITAGSFTGGTLKANAKGALTINGGVTTSGADKWKLATGEDAPMYAVALEGYRVSIDGSLTSTAGSIYVKSIGNGIGIGSSTDGDPDDIKDITIAGNLSAAISSTLESEGNITLGTLNDNGVITAGGNVTGGDLKATAADSILMGNIGTSENPVGDAELTAQVGSITAGSFTGNTLKATALKDLTINGGVTASGNAQWQPTVPTDETEYAVVLEGSGVSIDGSLTANGEQPAALYFKSAGAEQAGAYIRSTGGDITITGNLSAKGSSTLDSKGNITLGTLNGKGEITAGGNVTGGDLKAMAADSILMGNIGTSENPEGDVELTAQSGTITAGSFTGNTLKANAKGALTFNGDVEASGADKWKFATGEDAPAYAVVLEGASVSVNGSLTSTAGSIYVKSIGNGIGIGSSTDGAPDDIKDITITGNLSAAISSTLESEGNITLGTLDGNGVITDGGNVSGGTLTATAADSILMGNIGTSENPVGDAELTAQIGGITVGKVNTGKLTATAARSITMNDVKVSQTGAQIVSTGACLGENEYANVVLNSFHGAGAQIKASHGSITVEKSVSGAGSEFKNELHARVGVHFKGTADDNNLSNTNIFTPVLNWDNAARLTTVQVRCWDGPGGSPTALVNVTVGGSLYMEHSTMVGDVQITTPTEEEQKVTLNLSVISGQVSGATQLVLNSGGVGNVVVNGSGNLTVTSSGNSDFYCVPRQEGLESLVPPVTVTQEIPTLILNGGSLTVSPATSGDSARLLVTELTVTETTTLNSGLRLEDSNDMLTFNVTEKNAVAWGGYAPGEAPNKTLLTVNGPFTQAGGSFGIYTTIFLGDQLGNPPENLEKGMWYALMTLEDGKNPDCWKYIHIDSTTDRREGQGLAPEDLVWKDGTLYYVSGAELKAATWAPTEESHLWNTTDRNWVQNDMRYRYMDGVTTVFDDTAFNLLADYEGDVYLKGVYTPSSVQVNNSAENDYTFMDDGAIAGTTTTLTKEGEGSLTIQNANSYSGGTILKQGTLVVANAGALGSGDVTQVGGTLKLSFDGQTSDFGTVTLQGGTMQIAGGAKDFNLVVTGTGARMEGDADNAFTGSLTLEAESHLVSAGSLASWDGPSSITMFNGSMLEMDTKHNIWINDITNLSVVGTATVKNAYLRINPYTNNGKYVLGNGVENLRGEGATAYCLDGSTFDLNDKTTNLNIIVWNEQEIKDNVVEYGTVDTNVDIHAASRLWLYDATIGENATFKMGNTAFLSMGGRSSKTARLNVFTFTGDYATIDDGTLFVEKTEDGSPLVLGTNLSGPDTNVSLRQGTSLDLTGRYLAVNKLSLDTTATSATIGNGMVNSAIVVEAGKTLHLGDPLEISGAVTGGGTLVKDTGGIVNITGSMVNFSGNLVVQGGFFNLLNATSLNNMADVTINKGTLGVYKEETPAEKPATANEGTLTITGGHKLTAGRGTTLNANLVMGGGNKARATLDVHAMAGKGGLQMGSTVTLTPGLVLLSEEDMDGVNALRYMGKYDLFYSVDGLSLDGTPNYLAELGLADSWVKAADVFANDMFKHAEDQYYVFYSGVSQGGNAGNVGTVYIMQVPEPATTSLSLLALAALAARRRK